MPQLKHEKYPANSRGANPPSRPPAGGGSPGPGPGPGPGKAKARRVPGGGYPPQGLALSPGVWAV